MDVERYERKCERDAKVTRAGCFWGASNRPHPRVFQINTEKEQCRVFVSPWPIQLPNLSVAQTHKIRYTLGLDELSKLFSTIYMYTNVGTGSRSLFAALGQMHGEKF